MHEAPFTPTVTLNEADNPIIIYLSEDIDGKGNQGWQIRVSADMDRLTAATHVKEVAQCLLTWYITKYRPDLAPHLK